MIRHVQISGSDYTTMQHMFAYRPYYSASIHTTGSISDSVITCEVTYESYDYLISILKQMTASSSFLNDLPSAEPHYSASL